MYTLENTLLLWICAFIRHVVVLEVYALRLNSVDSPPIIPNKNRVQVRVLYKKVFMYGVFYYISQQMLSLPVMTSLLGSSPCWTSKKKVENITQKWTVRQNRHITAIKQGTEWEKIQCFLTLYNTTSRYQRGIVCKHKIYHARVSVGSLQPFRYFVSHDRKYGFWPYLRLLRIPRPQERQMPVV